MTKKKIIITGALGQDGSNMADYLLKKGYKVYGMMRRSATPNLKNIEDAMKNSNFELVIGDITDQTSISNLVKKIKPSHLINFAANSFVGCSWDMPLQVFDTNAQGVLRCLEAIKNYKQNCRFYSAGSSEEFGDVDYSPQNISHPLKPRSPYGASKCTARHLVKVYRESYKIFAVHGILFNHEGIRRGEEFVTRKITKGVSRIYHEMRDVNKWRSRRNEVPKFNPIELGNLEAKRDWSDSEDFVRGVWLMLNQKKPKDYVLASGETHSIREFVEEAFSRADIDGKWIGKNENATFVHAWKKEKLILVKVNPEFYRPAEVDVLMGDSSPIRKELKWKPKTDFKGLVHKMVKHDIKYP
jgi:GDPmannose 4,6-dehydratase